MRFENKKDTHQMFVTIDGGEPIVSTAYEAVDYSAEDLKAFEGTYYSEELGTSYTLVVENKRLTAKHIRTLDFSFRPIKTDVFSTSSWYFGQVRFIRNEDQTIKGIRVSSGRVRNLWFEKQK